MMLSINIKKHKKLLLILGSLVAIYTGPSISAEFINITTQKQVSEEFNKELKCLSDNIYYEAGSESYEGKLAVATVVMNRVNSGRYPSSICGVVNQKIGNTHQFSWVGMIVDKLKNPYQWEESNIISRKVLTENSKHEFLYKTNAMYYHNTSVDPGWNLKKVMKIGNHIFYTNKNI
jgi:spore germination cell wall hydrolase CwlJ-like protein